MNIVNIEIYSIVILIVLISDYATRLKRNFNKASLIWFTLSISTILISVSNIAFTFSHAYSLRLLSIMVYLLSTILSSICVYMYVKYVFINKHISIEWEIVKATILVSLATVVTLVYVFVPSLGYELHSFDRSFLNKLLITAVIPNMVILVQYIIITLKRQMKLNLGLVLTLMISIVGLLLDLGSSNLFFVSASFTITTLIVYINKFEQLLNTDSLTGLSNKRVLDTFITKIRPNLIVAAYNMDINGFKTINDTYGHSKGDKALNDLAGILINSSRSRDLVIRNGGDEFLIIAVIRKEEDAPSLVHRIKEKLKEYNKESEFPISISIGYGTYKTNPKTSIVEFNKFLADIDKDMYLEKKKHHEKYDKKIKKKKGQITLNSSIVCKD